MRNFNYGCAVGAIAVAIVATAPALAQETTSVIRGIITSDGAPVPGATVVITHVPSGTKTTVTTDSSGAYSAAGIRAGGPFTVVAVAQGKPETKVTEIYTVVAQPYDVPIDLTNSGNDIIVTAAALPGARTVSQGPATVLNAAQIANVATVNRDIRDLMRRDPFARLDDTPSGGRAVSFAGQNARFNRFSVDGVPITDNFGLNPDGLPSRRSPIPLDAIGQFQTKVAPYDVREGNFQGGAINIVLRQGSNKFQGTGFFAYSSDELAGTKTKPGPGLPTGKVTLPNYTYKNFGAEISGPIIQDKVFFMVAGERLRAPKPIAEGPTDNNAGTAIPGLTQAQVDNVVAIAKSKYNYDAGNVLKTNGDKDDRLVAKIDANLSDTQRLSATYTYAKDQVYLLNNTFTTPPPGLGLSSNAYIQGNKLNTGVLQLNSDWSDDFSTEARGFYKDYVRIQDPLMGRGFAQFRVCTAPTSDRTTTGAATPTGTTESTGCATGFPVVSLGPDNSRQTNALHTKTWGLSGQARLTAGDHSFKAFFDYANVKIFNSFLQNSAGNYYFDSIADFQAGNAQSLVYQNAIPSFNPDDAAARFAYQSYAFGVQDSWHALDSLNLYYGVRMDLYAGPSRATLNPNFVTRYGFANNAFLSGRMLFQPRLGFDFNPTPRINIRGGGGIFGGGAPDVYVSNSFSNTGVLSNTQTIRQQNNNAFSVPGLTGAAATSVGTAALVNVTGTSIPGAVNTYLGSGAIATTSTTNALDPNFKIPSQWRATLTAEYKPDLGALGTGWLFGADILYSKVRNQVLFTDLRSAPITGSFTPDGRQRYTGVAGFTDSNSDFFLTNTKKGYSKIAVARVNKTFGFGLDTGLSFTYQKVTDQAPATSSTASSNYGNGAFLDANRAAYGTSNDQVKYAFKYNLTFDHAFFGDNKTTIALFGETRIGRPYSYTMLDATSGRSPVFGTIGSGSRYLLYVPTVGDTKVTYDSAATQAAFESFLTTSGLDKYRGKIAPRNKFNSRWFTRFDLHLSQEVPTGLGDSKVTLFADIENVTNLINKKWGQIREYAFPYTFAAVRVACLATPQTAPGTTSAANTTTAQACNQYRYSSFTQPVDTVYSSQSLYSIRVGARFSF